MAAYLIRTVGKDGESCNGFRWPLEVGAKVTAPDAKRTGECGNGLHGLRDGKGDWSLVTPRNVDCHTIVFSCDESDIEDLSGKQKCVGEATIEFVAAGFRWAEGLRFLWSKTGGAPDAQASGRSGHAQASGEYGHAQASGEYGHAQASGEYGHAQASGWSGHAQASGWSGHAQASGGSGMACALGYDSKVRAADNGAIIATWYDREADRPRVAVGYVGEDGIEPGVWYHVENGKFVAAE